MAITIPTHSQWKTFKAGHKVGSNAVSSVNVGKALDKYHGALSNSFAKNAEAASALYHVLNTYLAKYPDKKSPGAKKFLDEFEKKYVNMSRDAVEEFKTMAGELKAFAGRVVLMLTEAGKLKPGSDLPSLQTFRQGPVRGMLAASTKVKGYDPDNIYKLWKPIDDTINGLGTDSDQPLLDRVVKLCHVTAKATLDMGKKDGLF